MNENDLVYDYYNCTYKLSYIDSIIRAIYNRNIKTDFYNDKELGVVEVNSGYVLPYRKKRAALYSCGKGGVLNSKKEYVIESSALAYNGMRERMNGGYLFKKYDVRDESVIFLGNFKAQWGHFLVDWIVRLWFMINDNSDKKIVYIGDKIEGNYLEFIELLGIDKERLCYVNNPTLFKSILVPEPSHVPGKYYTKEYKYIIDIAIKNAKLKGIKTPNYSKVYLSRRNIRANGMEIGEKEIESKFNENGFVSICPEEFSVTEQICILQNVDNIVTTEGTLAHNVLFCKEGIDVTIINKKCSVNPHQFIINQLKRLNVTYIDSYIAFFDVTPPGPYVLTVNKNLKDYFIDNNLGDIEIQVYSHRQKKKLFCWMILKYLPTHKKKGLSTLFNIYLNPYSNDWKIYHYYYKG